MSQNPIDTCFTCFIILTTMREGQEIICPICKETLRLPETKNMEEMDYCA